MKIEIDDNSVEELKLFIGMIIGKDIRREDGLVANYSGDEFTGFPLSARRYLQPTWWC